MAGRTITVTELDGRRIARLRVTATILAPSGPPGETVSAGQVRLDSEAAVRRPAVKTAHGESGPR